MNRLSEVERDTMKREHTEKTEGVGFRDWGFHWFLIVSLFSSKDWIYNLHENLNISPKPSIAEQGSLI